LIIGDKPYSMTTGIGADLVGAFSAALFVGYHAGAGHPSGIMGHTYSGATVLGVRVNGVAHNEAALNALRLGQYGIAVALVSGDDALAAEVEELLPWAERVIVKRGIGATVADSLSPVQAQAAIGEGVERALGRRSEMQLYALPGPLRLEVDLRLPVMADYAAVLPAIERVGPRTVAVEAADADTMYRWFVSILRLAAVPWT
jgi:D-amino peptidase